MDEREKLMLERIRPERHLAAMMTLANIKFIKEECTKKCIFNKPNLPEDYNEYDITERIYK